MKILKKLDNYRSLCIWKDETPYTAKDNTDNLRLEYDASSSEDWYEGTICIEARLNPRHASNYAMICMNYVKDNQEKLIIEINTKLVNDTFISNVVPNSQEIYLGFPIEYVNGISESINKFECNQLPKGKITIWGGGYDKCGSSIKAFEKTMTIMMILLKNIDNLDSQYMNNLLIEICK